MNRSSIVHPTTSFRIPKAFFLSVLLSTVIIHMLWLVNHPRFNRVLGVESNLSESLIISLTNLERTQAGLKPLLPSPELSQAAGLKADSMIAANKFEHYYDSSTGTVTPWQFIVNSGYQYHHAGENLARHFFDSQELMQAWMDSPTHKQNILNPNFTHIGVAVRFRPFLDQDNSTLVVQLFASPLPVGYERVEEIDTPPTTHTTPILTGSGPLAGNLIRNYPSELLALTIASTIVILGLVAIDIIFLTKARHTSSRLNSQLWRH